MMREIAASAGNFRGVCPTIGRLSETGVYRRYGEHRPVYAPVFSWPGV